MKELVINELDEVKALSDVGDFAPMLCDTPVAFFRNGIPAGYPEFPGDYDGEMVMIPNSLLNVCDFVLPVCGESMTGVGINDGDSVMVKRTDDYSDGDVVVALLDGESTLKAIFRDGDETWLVPANDRYQVIRLSDFCQVYILGRVTSVRKKVRPMSYKTMEERVSSVRRRCKRNMTDALIREAMTHVLPLITTGRAWFSVYRVLTEPDVGVLKAGNYKGLKELTDRLFPGNDFEIDARNFCRLDVDSFRNSFRQWNERQAPVTGKRFLAYLAIAETLYENLTQHKG